MRILEAVYHGGDFDTEAGCAVTAIFHLVERKAVQPLLEKVIHVLTADLAVGDHIEAGVHLVCRSPPDHVIGFASGER